MTAAHLNATGEGDRLAGLTLMVTVLDQRKAGFAAAAIDEEAANIAIALSARKGYLDGRSLAEVFAWLRPTDLVWRYWVNNYVEGKSPAAFDVLYWNADTTRMAAALHRDMVTMGVHNSLVTPGAVSMLRTPVDLNQLTTDTYVVAGIADHISPWQACFLSARLLGTKNLRFVLSSSGHIASLVNPPGNPRASYRLGDVDEPDPEFWVESAEPHKDRGGRTSSHGSARPPLDGAPLHTPLVLWPLRNPTATGLALSVGATGENTARLPAASWIRFGVASWTRNRPTPVSGWFCGLVIDRIAWLPEIVTDESEPAEGTFVKVQPSVHGARQVARFSLKVTTT